MKIALPEGDDVVRHQIAVGTLGAAGGRNSDPAAGPPLQHPGTGDVVGMDMSFERIGQPQAELLDQRRIPPHLLEHRIDDDGGTAAPIGEQIGVGGGGGIEQLPKNQHHKPR